ncbi:hypothetical protein THAOC_13938 [Thalassiosira oceanica]|uniref:Protein-serine/threonine kinase n=1 Tax=Thalassiosira oceanica TaxID=159749 RepID=K0T4H3_THAOC|nr:hypothetical protein THAOC_13938 [Thalassiosira oceanica]|eukprot:EJK65232.1 hypothetical protein THAOC_13938 [Thalassiosira oceanica]
MIIVRRSLSRTINIAERCCGKSLPIRQHRGKRGVITAHPEDAGLRPTRTPHATDSQSHRSWPHRRPTATRLFSTATSSSQQAVDCLSLPHDSPEVMKLVQRQASKPQTSASLETLMKTGRGEYLHKMGGTHGERYAGISTEDESEATPLVLTQVASFLRRELPIRLARRIEDLSRVPLLQDMRSVQQVRELYTTSFLEILSMDKHPPSRERQGEWEERFAQVLENVYERHSSVLVQMAKGAFELRAAIRKGALESGLDDDGARASDTELQVGRDAVEFELMDSTHAFLAGSTFRASEFEYSSGNT